ncbi:MAG TPA: metallopeptidase TldD-related protein [Candidatus Limnocylindria bacterium]|nr:metallopeptidase TldD-related protein [Candidatus Limnocylindria bacterium]
MTAVGADAILAPLRAALGDAKGDEAELWAHRRRSAITRYARNEVHQNAVADEWYVQARVAVKGAVGIASANSLEPADLRRLLADARAAAELSLPNTEWPGLAEPRPMPEAKAFDDRTATADAKRQADDIRTITDLVRRRGMRAAGTHQQELTEDAVANTNGVGAYAPMTMAYLRALALADHGGSGWGEDLAWTASALDPAAVASRAIERAALDHDRLQLEPGDYEAVFEELAVAEVLRFMSLTGLTGQTLRDGRSFMAGRIGEQVTGPRFSLWEDALDPRTLAIPFDVEGTPKRRVTLVEKGIARGVVHDRQSGRWFGTSSTGHAADPRRYGPGGHAANLTMAGGDASREQLIGSVTHGVLITRFHYTNTPDPKRATMTGTTRDGTFLIEDGRITRALANVRYRMSALDLFAGIDLLGPQRLVRDWWSSNGMGSIVCLCPPVKVARATITGSSPL